MPTILCLDDFTCGLAEAAHVLRVNGCRVLAADDNSGAVQGAAETHLDAVLLNCHREQNDAALVTALRMLQPHAAIVMFSGYCGVPCHQLSVADACVQKGETPDKLLSVLRSVVGLSRYGFCRFRRGMRLRLGRHHNMAPNNEGLPKHVPGRHIMARWKERITMFAMFVAFVLAGIAVWAVVFFRVTN